MKAVSGSSPTSHFCLRKGLPPALLSFGVWRQFAPDSGVLCQDCVKTVSAADALLVGQREAYVARLRLLS